MADEVKQAEEQGAITMRFLRMQEFATSGTEQIRIVDVIAIEAMKSMLAKGGYDSFADLASDSYSIANAMIREGDAYRPIV